MGQMSLKRQIVHTVVYIGVWVAFPNLPLGGVALIAKSVGAFVSGASSSFADDTKHEAQHYVQDQAGHFWDGLTHIPSHIFHFLNPFD